MSSQPTRTRIEQSPIQRFNTALGEHFHRVEPIVYCSLLIVGGVQIVIRERFPNVHLPWPLIGGLLMAVLFGVVFVPPLLLLMQFWKNPAAPKRQPRGSPLAAVNSRALLINHEPHFR
jgi:hypothetical protein